MSPRGVQGTRTKSTVQCMESRFTATASGSAETRYRQMTDRDECRVPTCTRLAREQAGYAGWFCSERCEVRYEHLQADARDAAQEDEF